MILSIGAALLLALLLDSDERPPELTFEEPVDYREWYVSRNRKEKPNAFDAYKPIHGGMPQLPDAIREKLVGMIESGSTWDRSVHPLLAAYLDSCQPHLDAVEKAAEIADFWRPISPNVESLGQVTMPSLSPLRQTCRARLARAWMKQDNQADEMLKALRIVMLSSAHLQQDDLMIANLVSLARRNLVYDTALGALRTGLIKGDHVADLFQILRKTDPRSIDWSDMLLGEWAFGLDGVQYVAPGGAYNASRLKEMQGVAGIENPNVSPREIVELIEDTYQRLLGMTKGRPSVKVFDKIVKLEHERARDKRALLSLYVGSFARVYELNLQTEARRRATMISLALHMHHHRHGAWPKTLKKIDRKLGLKGLKTCRQDPYSGKHFKYRVLDGRPQLYSIGADRVDNNGQHDEKGWGKENGGDFVFRLTD